MHVLLEQVVKDFYGMSVALRVTVSTSKMTASFVSLMVKWFQNCAHFPNHPQRQHRQPCGQCLMKKIKSSRGVLSLHPRLIYSYKSVIESLQEMVLKPGFIEKCELWRG